MRNKKSVESLARGLKSRGKKSVQRLSKGTSKRVKAKVTKSTSKVLNRSTQEPRSKLRHSAAHLESSIRMRRARGHLDTVIQMVDEGRPCTDVLQQLSAVISALGGCRTLLFSGHLKTCLRPALKSGNEDLIDEIEKLSSRVMKVN